MTDTVPVVDMRAPDFGPALLEALSRASSALLTGHGVDPRLRARMIECTRRFFDSPREHKARVQWPGDGAWYGWQPVNEGAAYITGTRVPDLVERFEVHELTSYHLWPNLEDFRSTWEEYYRACSTLASRLVRVLAEELDLPAEELTEWTDGQFANLVANHYPPQEVPPLPGQTRVGAHTDRGGITLLAADEAPGGLEVRLAGRTWVPVVIPEDAYVVQVGDLFARWTNRRIPANVHRVVNPPPDEAATSSRLALVYFHYPSLDTLVHPAPSCVVDGRPVMEPVLCRDHLLYRQEQFKARSDEVLITS